MNRLLLHSSARLLCSVSTVLSVFCTSFPLLAAYAAVLGVSTGISVSLLSVVLTDLVGVARFAHVWGNANFISAIAGILGIPLAGWVYDKTQSYDPAFYLSGTIMAVSSLLPFAIPLIQKRRNTCDPNV